MKTVEKIETFDGIIHDSYRLAKIHLEKKFGELLTPLAHRLTQAEKYVKIAEILESELETMRALLRIHDDLKMEAPE